MTRPRERQALIEVLDKMTRNAIEHRARRSSWKSIINDLTDDSLLDPGSQEG